MSCSAKRKRQVGSCISTLVSSTKRMRPAVSRRRRGPGRVSAAMGAGRGGSRTAGRAGARRSAFASPAGAAAALRAGCGSRLVAGSSPAAMGSGGCAAVASADFPAAALTIALDLRRTRFRACSSSSRIVAGRAGGFGSGMGSGFPYRRQDLVDVARDLQATPLAQQDARGAEQEGRALDSPHLLAVHVLEPDHAEEVAEGLVGIRDQLEGQAQLRLEALVGAQAVARHAEDAGARGGELVVAVAEVHGLGGAARGVVLRIEVEDQVAAGEVAEAHRACSRFGSEFGNGLANCDGQWRLLDGWIWRGARVGGR